MNHYSAYNLHIESNVRLDDYKKSKEAETDLKVEYIEREIEKYLEKSNINTKIDYGRKGVKGRVGEKIEFAILNGSRIVISGDESVSRRLVRSLIQGVFMAVVLRQRGYLVLHSCGLAKGNFAFGFAGHASWGKSTLAAYFAKNGYTLLGDDILAIDQKEGQLSVLPGSPVTRLRPHAAKRMYPEIVRANRGREKYRISFDENKYKRNYKLCAMFILEGSASKMNRIVEVGEKESVLHLIEHTRVKNLITKPSETKRSFVDCSYIAKSIPIYKLRRRRGHKSLEKIYREVEGKFEL